MAGMCQLSVLPSLNDPDHRGHRRMPGALVHWPLRQPFQSSIVLDSLVLSIRCRTVAASRHWTAARFCRNCRRARQCRCRKSRGGGDGSGAEAATRTCKGTIFFSHSVGCVSNTTDVSLVRPPSQLQAGSVRYMGANEQRGFSHARECRTNSKFPQPFRFARS